MKTEILRALVEYDTYANLALLDTAKQLSDEDLVNAKSPSRGSIFGLIRHTLATTGFFLAACQGINFDFNPDTFRSLEALRDYARRLGGDLDRLISSTNDEDLLRVIEFKMRDQKLKLPIWQLLMQAFLHASQHRGELSILLSELGCPLHIEDIIVHFVETSGQVWPWRDQTNA